MSKRSNVKKINMYSACYKTKLCRDLEKCSFDNCYYAHSEKERRLESCLDYYYTGECLRKECTRSHTRTLPRLPSDVLDRFMKNIHIDEQRENELKRNIERAEEDADKQYKKRKISESIADDLLKKNEKLSKENTVLKEDNDKLKQMLSYVSSQLHQATQANILLKQQQLAFVRSHPHPQFDLPSPPPQFAGVDPRTISR